MKVVLDTNCLIMAISSRSEYHRIWEAFLKNEYSICVTNEILEEYVEVIGRNVSQKAAEAIAYILTSRENVLHIDPHFRFGLITADPDDNKFVDCAVAGNARYIVTEDKHFNVLKTIPFPIVEVLDIDQFLQTFVNS